MATPKKIETVEELNKKIGEAKGIFLADFIGLDVEQMTQLRKRLREESIEFKVIKNTLLRRALEGYPYSDFEQYLTGPNALAFSYDDPIKPAKVLNEFVKKYERPKLKASIVEGTVFDKAKTKELTTIPSKEVLIAKLLMILNSPVSNLVYTLQGIIGKFVFVLNAIKEKKESEGEE